MEELTYTVQSMHCEHCTKTVEGEISRFEGVDSVTADLTTKLVTIRGYGLSDEALRAAIDDAGYEAEP